MPAVVIGLTGGIACGKSTIATLLKRLGAVIIDADQESKRLLNSNSPTWKSLVKEFGTDILNPDQSINRRKLGNMVFGNAELLAKLNSITHPGVIRAISEKIERYKDEARWPAIVLDVPLLYEVGAEKLADVVWVVSVDEKTQIDRLMKRDKMDNSQALQRLEAQMPLAEKEARADAVIYNTGTRRQTREAVLKLWQKYVDDYYLIGNDTIN